MQSTIEAMERDTVAIYEREAEEFRRRRPPSRLARAEAFAARVPKGAVRADLGCGPGNYCTTLGEPVVALDAAKAMLDLVPDAARDAMRVQADLEALPFRDRSLGAAVCRWRWHASIGRCNRERRSTSI
jgi:trans-aconitate methyltransferase